jgi:Ca2+-binding RTX toxin-like protein
MAKLTATYSANQAADNSLSTSGEADQGMGLQGQSPILASRIETVGPYVSSISVTPELVDIRGVDGFNIYYGGNFGSSFTTTSFSTFLNQISGTITSEWQLMGTDPRYSLTDFSMAASALGTYTWGDVLSGNDTIIGGVGNDDLYAYTGNDSIEAGAGFDRIWAGSGDDYVQGGFNGDHIYGEEGNDDLRGGNGLDLIVGGVGNDTIRGAKGTDTLTGGEGADVFIFHTDLDGTINVDTITDFVSGVDRIELSASIFGNAGAVGANVGLSQYITYNAATGVLSYDQDGAGSGAALAFAVIGTDSHPTSVDNIFWITA